MQSIVTGQELLDLYLPQPRTRPRSKSETRVTTARLPSQIANWTSHPKDVDAFYDSQPAQQLLHQFYNHYSSELNEDYVNIQNNWWLWSVLSEHILRPIFERRFFSSKQVVQDATAGGEMANTSPIEFELKTTDELVCPDIKCKTTLRDGSMVTCSFFELEIELAIPEEILALEQQDCQANAFVKQCDELIKANQTQIAEYQAQLALYDQEQIENRPHISLPGILANAAQVYNYMAIFRVNYAILTSYRHTWLFKRNGTKLFVSRCIGIDQLLRNILFILYTAREAIQHREQPKISSKTPNVRNWHVSYVLMEQVLLGRYEIIGEGRSGTVVKVRYRDRDVALKVADCYNTSNEIIEEIKNEVDIYKHLWANKTNTKCRFTSLIYAGYIDYFYGIVTEFVEGKHIEFQDMDEKQKADCLQSLQEIHRAGVCHGDIRSDNFIYTDQGFKVIDFGFATISQDTDSEIRYFQSLLYPTSRAIDSTATTDEDATNSDESIVEEDGDFELDSNSIESS